MKDIKSFKIQAKERQEATYDIKQNLIKETPKTEIKCLETTAFVPYPEFLFGTNYSGDIHSWQINNWGCKWGICDPELTEDIDNLIQYRFDSPWNPPIEVIQKMSCMFPKLEITIDYDEGGMCFSGMNRYKGGNQIDSEYNEGDNYKGNEE